jgi:hypothetical protein
VARLHRGTTSCPAHYHEWLRREPRVGKATTAPLSRALTRRGRRDSRGAA